MDIVVAQQY